MIYPLTIQDASYSSSMLDSFTHRGWYVLPMVFILCLAALLFVPLALVVILPSYTAFEPAVLFVLVCIVYGGIVVTYKVYRRLGFKTFTGEAGHLKARKELDAIRSGARSNPLGIDVLRCDDDIWRDVVADALSRADVAVVDVSDFTANLEWELATAYRMLTPGRVILVSEEGSGSIPRVLALLHGDLAAREASREWPRVETHVLEYPACRAPVGRPRRRQIEDLAGRLRLEIAQRLVARVSNSGRSLTDPRS